MECQTKNDCLLKNCHLNISLCCSEFSEGGALTPNNFAVSVSTQPQALPLLTTIPTVPATSITSNAQLQPQANTQNYSSTYQPQITSFLHQFEQFANNKNVRIVYKINKQTISNRR